MKPDLQIRPATLEDTAEVFTLAAQLATSFRPERGAFEQNARALVGQASACWLLLAALAWALCGIAVFQLMAILGAPQDFDILLNQEYRTLRAAAGAAAGLAVGELYGALQWALLSRSTRLDARWVAVSGLSWALAWAIIGALARIFLVTSH